MTNKNKKSQLHCDTSFATLKSFFMKKKITTNKNPIHSICEISVHTNIHLFICLSVCLSVSIPNWLIGLVGKVFTNGLGDLGSIPGRIIPKTLKMVLDTPCLTLSNIRYISRVKWSNPGKGVPPSPTPRCSSYWKGSLRSPSTTVADFTYLPIYIYIYIYIYMYT